MIDIIEKALVPMTVPLKLDVWKKWLRLLFIPVLIFAFGYICGRSVRSTVGEIGRFHKVSAGIALDTETGLECLPGAAADYPKRNGNVPLCVDLYLKMNMAPQYSSLAGK